MSFVNGQDWSGYQPEHPDVTGLGFAFTKVTEGLSYTNPHWAAQRDWAKQHGLVWGAYHYPHMANDPKAEADFFLGKVAWKPGDIIVLDWEGYDAANKGVSKARQIAYRDAWLKYVKAKMPTHQVGMYANTDYWLHVDTTSNCGDFLWIATAGKPAGSPGIKYPWTFHQYSTANDRDHDVARFGTKTELVAWSLAKESQKIPFASQVYYYGDKYPGSAMKSNVGVMHTTEGYTLPDYSGGSVAPNVTALPDIPNRKIKWYQHFDVDRSSRALVNQPGGVETNTLNAFQIELVGTCDPAHRTSWGSKQAGVDYLYWPDAPDWALAEVAVLVKWLHDNHGFQNRSTVTWKAYPGSYGTSNGVRLSNSAWLDYYGWLGHQHVPENLHGDPGDLDMARILAYANGTAEEDVALTDADIKKIFDADLVPAQPPPYNNTDWDTNKTWTFHYALYTTVRAGREANDRLQGVKEDLAALSAKVDALTTGGVDLDALAAKVADVLHDRLAG